jgi:hypothetical protein
MRGRKTGGRQAGTPNKASAELRAFAQGLLGNADYRKQFEQRFLSGDLHPRLEEMIWHYAGGKPTEHVQIDGDGEGGPVEVRFVLVPATKAE